MAAGGKTPDLYMSNAMVNTGEGNFQCQCE